MSFPDPFYKWRPHPWHGLETGTAAPSVVNAYIEITPFDLVKYEVDKATGYMRVDRPQQTSSLPPTLYGFIPRTYCAERVNALSPNARKGDHDPLDICVLSERPINRNEVILNARVVGGIRMVDHGEADDKIIAVLANDAHYESVRDIDDLPDATLQRLKHYFSTYKLVPGERSQVQIDDIYDAVTAHKVILASMEDYNDVFGDR